MGSSSCWLCGNVDRRYVYSIRATAVHARLVYLRRWLCNWHRWLHHAVCGVAMSKTGIIIQARLGSTRFPAKVIKQLGNSTVLGNVIQRCCKVDSRFDVILACPEKDVRELSPIADYFGVDTFGGSELDVLDRYYQCAKKYALDYVIRITSDCWAVDPDIIRLVIDTLRNNPHFDYVSNVGQRVWPKGLDVEAFTFEALAHSHKYATMPFESHQATNYYREHVCPYLREKKWYATANLRCPVPDVSEHVWCIDFPADLEFARKLWPLLAANFTWRDVLKVLSDNPQIQNPREEKAA